MQSVRVLGVLLLLLASPSRAQLNCAGTTANVSLELRKTGPTSCVPYSGICSPYIGGWVLKFNDTSIAELEYRTMEVMKRGRQAGNLLSDACLKATDRFMCSFYMLACDNTTAGTEPVPKLPCLSVCESYWSECRSTFDAFYTNIIAPEYDGVTPWIHSEILFCGTTGHYSGIPTPPADVWGGRLGTNELPEFPPYPSGYTGQEIFPNSSAAFLLTNGTSLDVPCYIPFDDPATALIPIVVTCADPLTLDAVSQTCKIPCPYPAFTADEMNSLVLAFGIPGLVGGLTCLFVLLDAIWQILYHFRRARAVNVLCRSCRRGRNPAGASSNGAGSHPAAPAQLRELRAPLKPSVKYGALGALLGLLFFILGPLLTLAKGTQISCAPVLDDVSALLKNNETPAPLCQAQRVSPFVLQLLFNVVFYAVFNVWMGSRLQTRSLSRQTQLNIHRAVKSYCLLPILCLIVALALDAPAGDFLHIHVQLARQVAFCQVRLSLALEIILVFLPFVFTGVMLCVLSLLIFRQIVTVRRQVDGLTTAPIAATTLHAAGSGSEVRPTGTHERPATTPMEMLLRRLMLLGLGTFALIIAFIASTIAVSVKLEPFAQAFSDFFNCVITGREFCQGGCDVYQNEATATRIQPVSLAIQLFCLSSIMSVFGLFFSASAVARLMTEHRQGKLFRMRRELFSNTDNEAAFTQKSSSNKDEHSSQVAVQGGAAVVRPSSMASHPSRAGE